MAEKKMTASALSAAGCPEDQHDNVNAALEAGAAWDIILQLAAFIPWTKLGPMLMEFVTFIGSGTHTPAEWMSELLKILAMAKP